MNYKPKIISDGTHFKLIDSIDNQLKTKKITRILKRYNEYFEDINGMVLSLNLNYIELTEFIEKLNNKLKNSLDLDDDVQKFILQNEYAIKEQRVAGITIKDQDKRWYKELQAFSFITEKEISRALKLQQIQASFYFVKMKKAGNFSVPGAGKTAMMYGAFAYLSSLKINEVDRIVVISPLNAFEAWKDEFKQVFGSKRELHYMNLKKYDNSGSIRTDWGAANVITLNYESLFGWKLSTMNQLIDEKTMIVFDEVHRIKNPQGKRAQNALALGQRARYRYVLTGTPIPNSYKDIYNFLHLLYNDEYNSFFGWSISDLDNPDPSEINMKLQPFFWRTNKKDLKVPFADEDYVFEVAASERQNEITKTIYEIEDNILARYIRLLQASTNPALLTEKIDLHNLGFLPDDIDLSIASALDKEEEANIKQQTYLDLDVKNVHTPKFERGIQLIKRLASENKKIVVWGMFVGTMKKVYQELNENGIVSSLIYGDTPKDKRVELIDEFRDGSTQVLISNPATLGESISLHQTVHDAVYLEYNFNLTFMLQSRDRIHRLGLADDQYTRYYYLMTEGDAAHQGFIDQQVYNRLKEKEKVMIDAIDGELLVPMIEDDYLEDVKKILK